MGLRVNNLLRSFRKHQPDVNALSAQLDGVLDPRESARLDAHVASCDACRAQLDGLRTTRAALRSMPEATRHARSACASPTPFPLRRPLADAALGARRGRVRGCRRSGGHRRVTLFGRRLQQLAGDGEIPAQLGSRRFSAAPNRGTRQCGAALDAGAATDASGPIAPDAGEIAPSTGEVGTAGGARKPPDRVLKPVRTRPHLWSTMGATTRSRSDAARAVATAAVQIQAAAAAAARRRREQFDGYHRHSDHRGRSRTGRGRHRPSLVETQRREVIMSRGRSSQSRD